MARYTEQFHLTPQDVHLIEEAIRHEIAFRTQLIPGTDGFEEARRRTRALHEVLGKLYNQKVFYAQVNETGVPAA